MKKKRGTPRRRKRAAKSSALVRRPRVEALPAPEPGRLPQALTSTPQLGDLGLVELKLTPEEEQILNEPVDPRRVLIKPTKAATPYLPHAEYTRWFNRAFGRLGWALVPCSTAAQIGHSIQCSYLMYVHGKPVAFAVGEQEYHPDNKEQTYGDALESTNASALRRLAKRMGVGLELWDRDWLDRWIADNAVLVKVEKNFKDGGEWRTRDEMVWRRKDGPPLYNEVNKPRAAGKGDVQEQAGYNVQANEPITEAQAKRFWTIARKAARTDAEIAIWLEAKYNVKGTREIKRRDYDEICKALEKRGPLPMPREPGEEG